MQTRRELGRLLGASAITAALPAAAAAKLPTRMGGVEAGVCLYNFRDIARAPDQDAYIGKLIDACVQAGSGLLEVNAVYIEPRVDLPFQGLPRPNEPVPPPPANGAPPKWMTLTPAELQKERERLRQWRLTNSEADFAALGKRFRSAGLTPFSYVATFTWDMTDAEIEAIFRHARGLGVHIFSTNQTKVETAPRLKPFAERYRMDLGFHNHAAVGDPNEVASIASFEKLFALSPRFKANLDVGHFVAANQDPVAFIKAHERRITHLHLKDRKRDQGPNMPWGQGDTPLAEILAAARRAKPHLPCFVEYEYRGAGGVVETRACLDFMRRALA